MRAAKQMNEIERRKNRLFRLPSVENWARNNRPRLDDTFFALSNFDKNPPHFGLGSVKMLCASLAKGKLTLIEALQKAEMIKHAAVRSAALQVIPAFADYLRLRPIEGLEAFDDFRITYPIGPRPGGGTLSIPIVPTFVGIRDEQLVPVFIIPWSDLSFDDFQKVLASSVLKDALLSHQQFIGCDGEIVAFPKIEGEQVRYECSWSILSYAQMDREDLSRQFSVFGRALMRVVEEIDEAG
ncbi:MAG TPA: hypothetical protein VF605_11200 [Allosphingosinicella sp.]|jgi:hypothetical protein